MTRASMHPTSCVRPRSARIQSFGSDGPTGRSGQVQLCLACWGSFREGWL
jgi:hypothetical protein